MKAARVLEFGPPAVITIDDLPRPKPGPGQVLVRVCAAGVGPWDALVREGKSGMKQALPLILGSELSGRVDTVGPGVTGFKPGDDVYGATNEMFTGAYVEYALASGAMIADKPGKLTHLEAASSPIGAVTAWQMLFEFARATAGQTVLVHGAAGNVGAYAVQLAARAGLHTIAVTSTDSLQLVKSLGADQVVDYRAAEFEAVLYAVAHGVDVVLDTVGGETQRRSLALLKPGGILVSVLSKVPEEMQREFGVRTAFFYVEVTTARLNKITERFDAGSLVPQVGEVLPLEQARRAHEMLAGSPHKHGKIVLRMAGCD